MDVPFTVIDWSQVAETEHFGESGVATWRTMQLGSQRVRMVRYSPGYRADHWCTRGHVVYVVEGVLVTQVEGGATHTLTAGQSYEVSSGVSPHRSSTESGAVLFIVD